MKNKVKLSRLSIDHIENFIESYFLKRLMEKQSDFIKKASIEFYSSLKSYPMEVVKSAFESVEKHVDYLTLSDVLSSCKGKHEALILGVNGSFIPSDDRGLLLFNNDGVYVGGLSCRVDIGDEKPLEYITTDQFMEKISYR